MWKKLALILLVAPLATALVALPLLREGAVLLVAAYPVLFMCSAWVAPICHRFVQRVRPSRAVQLATFALVGSSIAGGVTLLLFWNSPAGPDYTLEAVITYGAIGALHAAVIWVLYTFGPLKVAPVPGEGGKL